MSLSGMPVSLVSQDNDVNRIIEQLEEQALEESQTLGQYRRWASLKIVEPQLYSANSVIERN